jgi:alpha-1,2-mannosyltransferase
MRLEFGEWAQRPVVKIVTVAAVLLVMLVIDRQIVRFNGDMLNRDFFLLWAGGRGLLEGVDIYDSAVWADLHVRYGSQWLENRIFTYPLPAAFLFLPLALLPVALAATVWELFSQVMLVASVVALLAGLGSRRSLAVLLLPLVLLSRPAIIISTSGQFSAVWPFSLCLFYFFARRGRYALAGGVLTLLLLKPSLPLLILPVALVWLLARRAWKGVLAFSVVSLGGLGLSLILEPGWLGQWVPFLFVKGDRITPMVPTLWGLAYDLLAQRLPGSAWLVVFAVTVGLSIAACAWWLARTRDLRAPALWLACAVCLSIAASPYAWPYDQVLLLFPLGVVLVMAEEMSGARRILAWAGAIGVMDVLPYACLVVAERRGTDTLSALLPLAMLLLLVGVAHWSSKGPREPIPSDPGGAV